ncbi:hypothetical protein V3C99_008748 [Haemonchus contortus]|uniref:PRP3 domain-containing protein n=1 Tax=Haemonchus contortus TaxID=6289 RepID=A0A7I4YKQ1_HAECO
MAEWVASEDAERTVDNASDADGEPVHQAIMDVDMAERCGDKNAELEEFKRQLKTKQRAIDPSRAEQTAVKKGFSATDGAIPEEELVNPSQEAQDASKATICKRVRVAPVELKWVAIKGKAQAGDRVLEEFMQLESVKIPKTLRPRGNPSVVVHAQPSGEPVIKDGRVFKRHSKRVQKRKLRSLQRATKKKLDNLSME